MIGAVVCVGSVRAYVSSALVKASLLIISQVFPFSMCLGERCGEQYKIPSVTLVPCQSVINYSVADSK